MTKSNVGRRVTFLSANEECDDNEDDSSQTSQKRKKSVQPPNQLNGNYCHSEWTTCHYNVLPKWLQDNDYLYLGHRPPLPSLLVCFQSVFRLHTETGNILTHGFGLILFVLLALYLLASSSISHTDRQLLAIFFVGVIFCHLFSSLYHTCKCHSPKVSKIFHKLDYCGISLQIICSMIPAFVYGFYNNPILIYIYTGLGLILCFLCFAVTLWPKFGEPQYRPLRAFVFLTFGLSNVIPGLHWLWIIEPNFLFPFYLVVLQGLLYVIGAVLYAVRVPERLIPGKCDYWFQSHQIFHALVTIAACIHLTSIYNMMSIRAIQK